MVCQHGIGWENGSMVPTTEPDYGSDDLDEDDYRPSIDPKALLRQFVYEQLGSNRCLYIECFALAVNICYSGSSMAEIARRYGITRAAVSKRCIEICKAFRLPPSRAMRNIENRKNCRISRLESRAKQGSQA